MRNRRNRNVDGRRPPNDAVELLLDAAAVLIIDEDRDRHPKGYSENTTNKFGIRFESG